GLLHDEPGPLLQQPRVRRLGEAARITGVAVGDLLVLLAAGEAYALGVYDDDVVADVGVRRVDRLVLALEDLGDLRSEASEHDTIGIHDVPAALDVLRLGSVGLHTRRRRPKRPTAYATCAFRPPSKDAAARSPVDDALEGQPLGRRAPARP